MARPSTAARAAATPKSAATPKKTKAKAKAAEPAADKKAGEATKKSRSRRGRPKKTLEELDAEMADYFKDAPAA